MCYFIKYGKSVVLFLGICSVFFVGASRLPYSDEIFTGNPTTEGKGFYFLIDTEKKTKKYPASCEEFYQLWEAKKYSLDVDVYSNDNSYYRSQLGGCLLSKWADFSRIDVKDNIINQTGIRKITNILPPEIATIIPSDNCEQIELAEKQHKTLSFVLHDMPLRKEQRDPERYVEMEDNDGYYLRIEFYGAIPDGLQGKVYPIATFYHAGDGGTYNASHSYLLSKNDHGDFFIVHRFPDLYSCNKKQIK